ncbi:MAG: ABC transporter ATP-binding protein [Bacillota bacterium]|nr:MAG: ABC transporter ATP-binding protein [Bacillota bacterium]
MNIPLRQYINLLLGYLRPQWARALLLALMLLLSIALQLVNPQFLRRFIDTAVAGGTVDTLLGIAALYMAFALGNQLLSAYSRYVGENVGWTATNLLRADLAEHCLRLDMGFQKTRTPGEMIERIDGDVNALSNFFSQFVVGVLGNLILLVGALVLLWRVNWMVGLGLTLFAVGALAIMLRIREIASPHWAAVRQANAEFYGFLSERLAGTEDIRSSGGVAYVMRRFHEITRGWLVFQRKAGMAWSALWMTNVFVFALGTGLAFALSAHLYGRGEITIGTAYLIFNYTELIRRPLEQIRTQMQDLQKAAASISRVRGLFDIRSRVKDGPGDHIPRGALDVTFDSASFTYEEDDEPVLHDLSFHLEAGRTLGLLGRTGSGKTTLARLLFRLYDPTEGDVRLGGVSLRAATLADLRSRVGMVTQEVQLFHATVRDNLTFFDSTVPDERILEVLEDLGLGPWCRSLSAGLNTEIASGASGLSAGEAQLLAFARLFLADPGLVVLDEASSRLDPATERLLERAVDKVLEGRTGIIIAHRLATVHRADEILILDNGRVLEHGDRKRLAADPKSHFCHLLEVGLEELLA